MQRILLRIDWVLAAFLTVMSGPSVTPADPIEPPCRGGVLYGTVWAASSGGWSGSNVSVFAVRTDESGILGSARTDAGGRYRICGLPLRTRFQLVAVPSDQSGMGHVETMILTLEGGQQRNIYPTRALQRLPDLVLRRPTESVPERTPEVRAQYQRSARESVVQTQIRRLSEAEALARASQYVPTPGISRDEAAARGSQYVPPPGVSATADSGGKLELKFVDVPDHVSDSSLRVVSGDGLLMYFSGSEPRYMQLRVDGLDGRGCYFEFDWGIDEQSVESTGIGYDLVNPAWGRIRVERQGDDLVSLDMAGVYTPVCRARSAYGDALTWQRGTDGWARVRP